MDEPSLTPTLSKTEFGLLADGSPVDRYVLTNGQVKVAVLSYGAIVQEMLLPDRDGNRVNVVLGFSRLADYERHSPFFGAVIGRFANRIAMGRFTLDGVTYALDVNDGPNTLHGGARGFDRKIWDVEPFLEETVVGLRMSVASPDGDEYFPGHLTTVVTYTLTADDELHIDYAATNDEPEDGLATVVNLTHHAYFNLAGEGSGTIEAHVAEIRASRYTPVGPTAIPTGEIAPVEGTPMDFRAPKAFGEEIRDSFGQLVLGRGYDHNWVLDDTSPGHVALAARVSDPGSGRTLETWTDQPGMQLYTGNFLDGSLVGTSGRTYRQGDAFCLETQHFPDSPNQPAFPSTVLHPQETFRTTTRWRFSAV